jgi:hypothetical protein
MESGGLGLMVVIVWLASLGLIGDSGFCGLRVGGPFVSTYRSRKSG